MIAAKLRHKDLGKEQFYLPVICLSKNYGSGVLHSCFIWYRYIGTYFVLTMVLFWAPKV
jgi:hypothetical protein